MNKLLALLALVAGANASAARLPQVAPLPLDQCKSQALYGFPTTTKPNVTIVCRAGYVTAYDTVNKTPVWEAYVLTPEHATGCSKRSNAFAHDDSVPQSGNPKDFAGVLIKRPDGTVYGIDLGHGVNDFDQRWSDLSEQQSFLMTNMWVQFAQFNRGVWKKLEDSTRGWAVTRGHPIQIYISAQYGPTSQHIPAGEVVPEKFTKILIDTVTGETAIFDFEHKAWPKADLNQFLAPIAQVQAEDQVTFPLPANHSYVSQIWERTMKNVNKLHAEVCPLQ